MLEFEELKLRLVALEPQIEDLKDALGLEQCKAEVRRLEAQQEDPDAKEVVVSLEDLADLEKQAAEGTLNVVTGAVAEEVEEVVTGGKGRTFLKICLVVLVFLLVVEIAGVAIKIAAPTSGAANFIDSQLHKVFQLFGDEDTTPDDYNA